MLQTKPLGTKEMIYPTEEEICFSDVTGYLKAANFPAKK